LQKFLETYDQKRIVDSYSRSKWICDRCQTSDPRASQSYIY